MSDNKPKKDSFEKLISGALLRFNIIDPVDLNILADEIKQELNIVFDGDSTVYEHGLERFLDKIKDGSYRLFNELDLDSIDKKEDKPIHEILEDIAGPDITEFFKNLDIKKYFGFRGELENILFKKVYENANVLLISDREEDYNALVKQGFKHINYFKSCVLADKFFKVHPGELSKYHIFIKGGSPLKGETDLEKHITNLSSKTKSSKAELDTIDLGDQEKIIVRLFDKTHHVSYSVEGKDYNEVYTAIVENAIVNETDFEKREDIIINNVNEVNEERMSYPSESYDLKILFLQKHGIEGLSEELAKKLGLDINKIDYYHDHNTTLEDRAEQNLGDYDIIIATDSFSHRLLNEVDECTCQCNYTGRNLVLLTTYETNGMKESNDSKKPFAYNGSKIKMHYKVAGPEAKGLELKDDEFCVLTSTFIKHDETAQKTSVGEDVQSNTYAILCAAIQAYNKALNNAKGYGFYNKVSYPAPSELNAKYATKIESRNKYKDYDETPVFEFDDMMYNVGLYLLNKENGLTDAELHSIRIETSGSNIKIINVHNGKDVATVTVNMNGNDLNGNKRLFELQTLKDGKLGTKYPVGLFNREHFEEYPVHPFLRRVPDEDEMNALKLLEFKVNEELTIINLDACLRQFRRNAEIASKDSILNLLNGKKD